MSPVMANSVLRVSPNFVLAFATDGRAYVAQDSEPYTQFWLSEHERLLHFIFGAADGCTAEEAAQAFYRLTALPESAAQTEQIRTIIGDMHQAGVLFDRDQDLSRYTAAIVDDYVTHRQFPAELSAYIIRSAPVTRSSRVIDLAGGPGDLAIALAQAADDVTLMDLSSAFLQAAAQRAAKAGVSLTTVQDSCNRLVYRDDEFDAMTVSQALHWLDDVMVCRGVCRMLKPGGSFFVVHSAIEVDDTHPLALVLGRHSVFGHKAPLPFDEEVEALRLRLTRLFEAFDTPDVHRIDLAQRADCRDQRIVAQPARLFTERRPFGLGYVNGFLTDTHIASTGREPRAFRQELAERTADAAPAGLLGRQQWAILQFTRGGQAAGECAGSNIAKEIGCSPAVTAGAEV